MNGDPGNATGATRLFISIDGGSAFPNLSYPNVFVNLQVPLVLGTIWD